MSEREDEAFYDVFTIEAKRQQRKREQVMSEPITVADALKALRMAQEACKKATAGPWKQDDDCFVYSEAVEVENESVGWDSVIVCNSAGPDMDFICAARAVLPGMVDFLIQWVGHNGLDGPVPCRHVIAPIVEWARTRKEWSK